MSEEKFSWAPAGDPAEWDRLVDLSPQGTIFSESMYIQLAERESDRFLVRQGNHVKAGVCVTRTPDGRGCELDDLVIHNGILFVPEKTKKPVRQRFEQFELTEFAIGELDGRYDRIELALAPQFEDLRPFLWHNYNDADRRKRFVVDLRYTSYVDVSGLAKGGKDEEAPLFQAMETLRQRHVRDARKKGGEVRRGGHGAQLVDFYRAMMTRQHEPQDEAKLARMRKLVDGLVARSRAAVYEVLNREGQVIYVTVYAWDSKRAYYLFGAGHPDINEPWQGTLAHWEAFKDIATRIGVPEVDMEGVNSPQRGWFKLGFGGDLQPYYQVYKGAPA